MALHQAPYDGIIRIRLKGQGNIHPNLSRLLRQHPCGVVNFIIHRRPPDVKTRSSARSKSVRTGGKKP